jgi:hypothetical protein
VPGLGALDEHHARSLVGEQVADLVVHALDAAGDHEAELLPDRLLADGRVSGQWQVVVRRVVGHERDRAVEVEAVDGGEELADDRLGAHGRLMW